MYVSEFGISKSLPSDPVNVFVQKINWKKYNLILANDSLRIENCIVDFKSFEQSLKKHPDKFHAV
jgi:hypothetical protein